MVILSLIYILYQKREHREIYLATYQVHRKVIKIYGVLLEAYQVMAIRRRDVTDIAWVFAL